jgi:hypothetical protein
MVGTNENLKPRMAFLAPNIDKSAQQHIKEGRQLALSINHQ